MKKKLGVLLLAGLMAGSVAACFSGCGVTAKPDFEMPEGGFDTTKEVEITFYHQMGSDLRDILDDYIEQFNEIYPNIKVTHTSQGDWNGIRKQISTEIQGGNQPNIAFCYPDHVALYNRSGSVQPLNGFLADGAFKDVTVTANKVDPDTGLKIVDENGNAVTEEVPLAFTQEEQDMFNPIYFSEGSKFDDGSKTYTIPWVKSTEMMFYNKDFFEEHELEVPTTWDEMETLCEKIKEIDPDAYPFGYDSGENWFITMCEQLGSGFTSSTGTKFLFDNEENRAFVARFKEWFDKKYFTTQDIAGTYTSDLFLKNGSYMSIGSTGGATYNIDLSGEEAPFEVGIAPVPQEDVSNTKLISQGPSVCIFKSDDPQEVIASWLFVKFFTTNPLYQTEVAKNNGYMPVLKKEIMEQVPAYTSWIEKANGSNYLTAQAVKVGMEHEAHYFVSPAFSGSSLAREQVGILMKAVFSGTKTLDKAFNDALTECTVKYGK